MHNNGEKPKLQAACGEGPSSWRNLSIKKEKKLQRLVNKKSWSDWSTDWSDGQDERGVASAKQLQPGVHK